MSSYRATVLRAAAAAATTTTWCTPRELPRSSAYAGDVRARRTDRLLAVAGAVLGQKDCISEQLRRYIAGVVRWNPEPKFLADLTRGHRLYGHCAKCGRTKVLDVNKLEQRFGPFFTLDEVRARVRCTKCKRRTNELRLVSERR